MSSNVRNRVLILPRRAGKTDCAFQDLINRAARKQGKYTFVEPFKTQAKKNVWREFLPRYVPKEIIKRSNDNELYLELINGSQIYFEGADNPNAFRGAGFDGIVWDEVREIKKEAIDVVQPILAQSGGFQTFISTPHGKDHFYDYSFRERENPEYWKTWKFDCYETQHISTEEIIQAKRNMTEEMFRQEFLCDFIDGGGEVFKKFRQCIDKDVLCPPRENRLYQMGVDLGKQNDFTVITVVDMHTWDVVAKDRFNEIDWALQLPKIEEMAKRYNNAIVNMDATGVGDMICETLKYRGLNVNGIKFGKFNKNGMVMNLKTKLENNEIRLPDWQEMIDEMEGYEEIVRADGVSSFKNGSMCPTDDIISSLLLAYNDLIEKIPLLSSNDRIIPNDDPFD